MDPQNGGQGGQRYCPTPIMAPPSPAPPMQHQHVPQPSLSPALHTGYYSHDRHGGGYPPPQSQQQQSYYQNYSYQSHGQPPAPQATHYSHQQQQHQQWGHHSYYQAQQSVEVGPSTHPQQQSPYQTEAYPPQAQSPYPAYVQQHQHQQQRMHSGLPPPPPQQQQPQPQHALMNLSRFVSQQSPPSPVPMPHSPTTPVPMGSPHYHQQQQPIQGHLTPQPIPQSMYPQSQTPQGHMSLPPPNSNLHSSPYHSPTIPLHSQNSNNHENQRIQQPILPNATTAMSNIAVERNAIVSNHPNQTSANMTSSSDQVQNPSNDISINSVNHHMMLFSNGGGGGGGRSESTSPTSSVSSRALLSPPPTPNPPVVSVSSASSNGHMIPVRLQNMQSGARTKASMRKMMQEQQISTVGGGGGGSGSGSMGSGTEDSNHPTSSDPESPTGKKNNSKKTPKKSKKGAASSKDEEAVVPMMGAGVDDASVVPNNDIFPTNPAASPPTVGQGRRGGRKTGRSPKPKKVSGSPSVSEKETPNKNITTTGRGRNRSSLSSNPENQDLVEIQQSSSPTRTSTSLKNVGKKKSPPVEDEVAFPDPEDAEEPQKKKKKKPKTIRGKAATGRKKSSPFLSVKSRAKKTPGSKKGKKNKKSASKVEPETSETPEALLLQIQEELNAIPTRPIRMRAAKEQAKKPEESKVDERSRSTTSRSKRGSVSYKEMSTSRSKSPKEVTSPPRPSPPPSLTTKKSTSPGKKSPKEKAKTVVKTPPRKIKDASPSPVRSRSLKEKSPLSRRESTRASKEESLVEEEIVKIPKRASRKSKENPAAEESPSISVEPDVKSPPTPKKAANKKSKRDTTPVRMPSPRLAKEKTSAPATPSKSTSLDVSPDQTELAQPKTPTAKRKAKSSTKARGLKKVKASKLVAAVRAKKRKISTTDTTPENEKIIEVENEPSEPIKKKAKVPKKRGGARQRGKARAPKSTKSLLRSNKELVVQVEDIGAEAHLGSNATPHEADTTVGSQDANNLSSSIQSPLEMESSFEMISSTANANSVDNNSSKSSVTVGTVGTPALVLASTPRRRSKSPRQSVDVSSVVSIVSSPAAKSGGGANAKGTGALTAELNLNITPSKDNKSGQPIPIDLENLLVATTSTSNLQLLSDSVNSIMSTASLTTGKIPKAKKPRKPRVPKARKVSATPETEAGALNQSSISETSQADSTASGQSKIEKKRKQTKHELRQLEIQRRKAYLEVEVAQALLDMKHNSSNSSSPSKIADALTSSTPSLVSSKLKKPTKPRKTPTKPRKRKISFDTPKMQHDQSNGPRLSTPLSSPIIPISSTISPDIASPRPKAKQPRKPKKARLDIPQHPPLTSTPTILAVPQINGNPGLNFSANSSISFQNTPYKTGPIKVSKTVILGMGETKTSTITDIESTIANVSTGFMAPSEMTSTSQKPKARPRPRKKNVVTKILSVTSESASAPGDSITIVPKPKRPRPRKKPVTLLPNLGADGISPGMMTRPQPGEIGAHDIGNRSGPSVTGLPPNLENPTASTPLVGVPFKKKRVYKNKRSLFKFSTVPKPLPVPTVFVKSPALQHSNGPTPSTSTSDKDKAPSLKVIRGKAVFYRGGEKEELDAEPLMSKPRGQIQFDPEVPWLCCFCSLGPHAQKLGDLFGPYYTEQTKGSGKSKTTVKVETWMHQDCALWAGSVVLIGSKLHGLEDALSHSIKDSCTTCGNKGATIGCLKRGCKQAVHFPCAVRKSWKLDEETFHSFCPAHIS